MSETKTIEERYEELEDLLRELRDAAQSSAHSYETGNLGASRLHDAEATATKEQILKLFSDLMAERGKMKERIEEYEKLYEDPCHAKRITDEDTGEPQWLLYVPKDPPEVLENHISLDPAAFEEGTRVCIYEPIKEARDAEE